MAETSGAPTSASGASSAIQDIVKQHQQRQQQIMAMLSNRGNASSIWSGNAFTSNPAMAMTMSPMLSPMMMGGLGNVDMSKMMENYQKMIDIQTQAQTKMAQAHADAGVIGVDGQVRAQVEAETRRNDVDDHVSRIKSYIKKEGQTLQSAQGKEFIAYITKLKETDPLTYKKVLAAYKESNGGKDLRDDIIDAFPSSGGKALKYAGCGAAVAAGLFLSGPIGWTIAGIGAVAGAGKFLFGESQTSDDVLAAMDGINVNVAQNNPNKPNPKLESPN